MLLKDELANNKTTLLSSRSKIEILNPNDPEMETTESHKSPLALLAATCSNIGKDSAHHNFESTSPAHSPVRDPIHAMAEMKSRFTEKLTEAKSELSKLQASVATTTVSSSDSENSRLFTRSTQHPFNLLPLSTLNALVAQQAAANASILPGGHPVRAAHHKSMLPYVGYLPVKTAQGGSVLVPICREPFCTNCQNAVKLAGSGASVPTSTSSCTQCRDCEPNRSNHPNLPLLFGLQAAAANNPESLLTSNLLHKSLLPISAAAAINASAVAAAKLAVFAPSSNTAEANKEVSCNWVSPDTNSPCGKHFSNVDELMSHIRTQHTEKLSPQEPTTSPQSTTHPLAALSTFANTTKPAVSTQSTFASMASALSARYHPYKSGLPTMASSLGAYYPYPNPYLLYDVPRA